VKAVTRLAQLIGRQPWLTAVGPRIVNADIRLQRWTGGRISFGRLAGLRSVTMTTTGRRTGQPRLAPLIAIPDGDCLLLVASNFGRPHHPHWSANLIANPNATAQINGHDFAVTATLLTGEDREQAWKTVTTSWPAYHDYQARAAREIRVFRVTRR
jgi:deazaflavin-dependent oxidoreductase (nitroreductase family)